MKFHFELEEFEIKDKKFVIENREGFLFIYDSENLFGKEDFEAEIIDSKCSIVFLLSSKNSDYKINFKINSNNSELALNIIDLSKKNKLEIEIFDENSDIELNSFSKNFDQKEKIFEIKVKNSNLNLNGLSIDISNRNLTKINVKCKGRSNVNVKYRSILKDNVIKEIYSNICGESEVLGGIYIEALRLSDYASIFVTPSLEIQGNKSKLNHNFALVELDEEKILYLCSRGIDERKSKELLVKGFLLRTLDLVKDFEFREAIKNILDQETFI